MARLLPATGAAHFFISMQVPGCTLLVDDDETTNYLNQKLLEKLGVAEHLLVAYNGQEALDLLQQHCEQPSSPCPTLVFLDIKMPVMDGFEFLSAFQQLPAAQQQATTIVVLTTSLHPQDVERIKRLPVAEFLNKPLTREKVHHILETHFNQS